MINGPVSGEHLGRQAIFPKCLIPRALILQEQLSSLALELTAGKARAIYNLSSLLLDGFQQYSSQGGNFVIRGNEAKSNCSSQYLLGTRLFLSGSPPIQFVSTLQQRTWSMSLVGTSHGRPRMLLWLTSCKMNGSIHPAWSLTRLADLGDRPE